ACRTSRRTGRLTPPGYHHILEGICPAGRRDAVGGVRDNHRSTLSRRTFAGQRKMRKGGIGELCLTPGGAGRGRPETSWSLAPIPSPEAAATRQPRINERAHIPAFARES